MSAGPFRRRSAVTALVAAFLLTIAVGCGSSDDGDKAASAGGSKKQEKITLGFSQIGTTGPFLVADSYGVIDEAKRQGVDMKFLDAGGFTGLSKQVSNTEDLLNQGVDALLIDPISADPMRPAFERAKGAKVPVIGTAQPVDHPAVVNSVTTSHFDSGVAMGKALLAEIGSEQANVVVLAGPPGTAFATERLKGFKSVVGDAPNVKILTERFFANSTRSEGLKLAEDYLKTFPNANFFYTVDNASGLGVADAVVAANKVGKVKILTTTLDADTIEMIRKGVITIDIAQQPVLIGRIAVRNAIATLQGKSVPKETIVPVVTITKDNLDEVDTSTMIAPDGFKP